ncbi:MAG: GNAT family N-acetyltransferase [Anaerolineales bacterium]|jgi:mycothiol synthase
MMDTIQIREPMENLLERGFEVRAGSPRDLRYVVPMLNRSSMAMYGSSEFRLARYHAKWRAPDLDVLADTRVVYNADGRPVALGEIWRLMDPPVHPTFWGRVDPEWEGLGIGSALLGWARLRALQSTADVPAGRRITLRTFVPRDYAPAVELMLGAGLQPIRSSWEMEIELDQPLSYPAWPEGLAIRTFDFPAEMEAVYQAEQEIFQDHWGFVPADDKRGFARWRHHLFEERPFDPSLWFLAFDGERIAGMAICRPYAERDPRMGWVSTLGVVRKWRRRGLGRALLEQAFAEFHRRGLRKVGLGVDSANLTGAVELYRQAGMHVAREFQTYELELRPGVELQTE